jgi:transcriptional regulator with XRE-family HTH domain
MTESNGSELRDWRRSRGWDVPELARQLRRVADEPIAAHDGLVRMIRAWERGDRRLSERYELLYRKLGLLGRDNDEASARSAHIGGQEGGDPVRRRTFVELTGISMVGSILPASAGTRSPIDIEPLALVLTAQMTGASPEPSQEPSDIAALAGNVSRARKHYQACRYAELVSHLPRLLGQLDAACCLLDGDDKLRADALSADAYHVAAGFLLKLDDHSLAHLATDRSMTAALASQDPLTVERAPGSSPTP